MINTRLYRSQDALLAGVCAGIAERLEVDPVVIRTCAVCLGLLSFGLGFVVYVVLWVVLPRAPKKAPLVDVCPEKVKSQTYGEVDTSHLDESDTAELGRDIYALAAHVPPAPPLAASAAQTALPETVALNKKSKPDVWRSVLRLLTIFVSLAVVFVLILRFLDGFVHGASWWRLWPIFFIVFGIALAVVPAPRDRRMARLASGLILIMAGFTLLPLSLQMLSWRSLIPWFLTLWPLLGASVAFLVVAWVRKLWPWALAACLVFFLFCGIGLAQFGQAGPVSTIIIDFPFVRDLVFAYPQSLLVH